jgi:hypothetical protein
VTSSTSCCGPASGCWSTRSLTGNQFGDLALTIFEQNNYQLTDEKSREIDGRVRRLELEVQPEILDARHVDGGMKDRHDSGRLFKSALGPVVI